MVSANYLEQAGNEPKENLRRNKYDSYFGFSLNFRFTINPFFLYLAPQKVDLRDVKDIRSGKNSSNFELSSKLLVSKIEELDEDRCFVVCYTRGFNIKTLSICGKSSKSNLILQTSN